MSTRPHEHVPCCGRDLGGRYLLVDPAAARPAALKKGRADPAGYPIGHGAQRLRLRYRVIHSDVQGGRMP
jgi:hypothetical protein